MSTVSFAGFSRVAGVLKFRTANDVKRIDQLRKLGDTDVVILALPTAMTKNDAAKHVLTEVASGAYMVNVAEAETLLVSLIKDENTIKPKAVKAVKKELKAMAARVKKEKITKVSEALKLTPREAEKVRAEFMKKLATAYEAA